MRFVESLPDVYAPLLPEDFLVRSSEVKAATCHQCVMADPARGIPRYKPDLKCCTYYPFIPNYLVGGILKNGSAEGKSRVEKLIARRQYALPLGIVPPPAYRRAVRGQYHTIFGRDPAYICPFYQWGSGPTGDCTVWRYRGSQCSTFFCVQDANGPSEKNWEQIRDGLFYLEMFLSQMCLVEKGYTPVEIDQQMEILSDRALDSAKTDYEIAALDWSRHWLHHLDDIVGFYLACYEKVKDKGPELLKGDREWIRNKKPLFENFPNLKIGKTDTNTSSK